MTAPLTGWPPPAAAAAALPSCAAAGPGTVKGPEPPPCSPTALCPPPCPSWDPKGMCGVGDTQARVEQSHWEGYSLLPGLGDHQVLHHLPLQGQRLRSRRAVGNITHTPWPPVESGAPPGTLSLPGCRLCPAPSPHLPGMFSARPGWGSAAPPAPRRPPSASGSAGRPPPAGSAPCRNGLSTRHRAQDTCRGHMLLRDSPGGHGATASPRVAVLVSQTLVFEPPMSYSLCLSPPHPNARIPAHSSPPCSTSLCCSPIVPAPGPSPPVLPCALRLSDLQLLEDLRGQERRELPPLVRTDAAVPGWGRRAPGPLLCSRFHLGFPWGGGRTGRLCLTPVWAPGCPARDPHPSLTQRRCDGFDPLQALLRQLQQFGGVRGDPLAALCGEAVLRALQGFPRPPWSGGGDTGSCLTCPCRLLLQGLGDEGDALQVLRVRLLPRWGLSGDPGNPPAWGDRSSGSQWETRGVPGMWGSPGCWLRPGKLPRDASEPRDAGEPWDASEPRDAG